ncbi:MAG: hypothetical protein WCP28_08015, partial [Actinomycetes bacterium]
AIRADADTIVTANLKDFLAQDLAGWGVRAIHPDAFLQELLAADPDRVITCLHEQRRAYAKPRFSVEEFYESLSPTVPQFAVLARGFDREQDRNQIPLPLEIVPGGEAYAAFFPDGEPDLATPLGAGFLWWSALLHRDQFLSELESLSYDADDWGDYEWAAAELEGRALLQGVRSCDDAPDEIAYLIFMPDSGHAMRAFGEAPIADAWVLTVVRAKDGFWRAWGLSNNYYPSADRIRHGTDD